MSDLNTDTSIRAHETSQIIDQFNLLFGCSNKKPAGINSRFAGMYKLYIIENQDFSGVTELNR